MQISNPEISMRAKSFSQRWLNKGNEKSDTQIFWLEFLHDIMNINAPGEFIQFEKRVELSHVSFIDAYISSTRIIIEQKTRGTDLTKSIAQSDGTSITPFEQAKRYKDWLPQSEQGRWIIICNFQEFRIHDLEHPHEEPEIISLENLSEQWERFLFVINKNAPTPRQKRELDLSFMAGELAGKLREVLLQSYLHSHTDKPTHEQLRSLNILCVRIVFLLYAEDSGLFEKYSFHDYLQSRKNSPREAIINLFKILNQDVNQRDQYLDNELRNFPYVNGGLFSEQNISIPRISDEALNIILSEMSEGFNWSAISPTIFGALFESTLNPETRITGGMHYTSIENIHKVIDPLFLDALTAELHEIINYPAGSSRTNKLSAFQNKLASLKFFDPACGSGNFLTETYLSLRRLENIIIAELSMGQKMFARENLTPVKISIGQFYGIEINDFAAAVARTALWIAEHQMMQETRRIIEIHDDVLPLKSYNHILEENALQFSWEDLISRKECSYIISNPPFRGARIMNKGQKSDLRETFNGWKNTGNLDYVACWYKKAWEFMKGTTIKAAFVSTNSINQGDNAYILWKPLFDDEFNINFAYKPFVWNNESQDKAHVHCVVLGFTVGDKPGKRYFYENLPDGSLNVTSANNINAYLADAPNVFVIDRPLPLFPVPVMRIGNKLIDGGYYLFTPEEFHEFIKIEPNSRKYFHLWYGGKEFLYNTPRYCLYLGDCSPHEIKSMPECYKRVQAVREYRLASKSAPTRKLADIPTKFHVETFPKGNYIVIPQVSGDRRMYIPMGFMNDSIFVGSQLKIIPDANLYHFGILESFPHMAWMRRICGRLGTSYRYSSGIVYNNYVWPAVNDKQRAKIERTARAILEARELYPDSNLAELYDENVMPAELRRAHRENDRAVCEAYGFGRNMGEFEIVNELMRMYDEITRGE